VKFTQNNCGEQLKIYINLKNKNMLSFKENIPIILQAVEEINPKSVLDIGAGMGKFGLLIREQYLSSKAEKGELEPVDNIVIDAVEDTKYLITDRMRGIYNYVFEHSILDLDFDPCNYDLMLLIDVVEHWEKQVGLDLLNRLTKKSAVLISTPKRVGMYKEHFYGDPRHHISQWVQEDFSDNFKDIKVYESKFSHIIYIPKQ